MAFGIYSGLIIYMLLPLVIGFLVTYLILKGVVANKKGRFFIKSKNARMFTMIGISLIVAVLCYYIVDILGARGYLRF